MNKNKLLSIISREQLVIDFNELGSATQIAKKYKINPMTVYSAFKIINFKCVKKINASNVLTKDLLEKEYIELQSFDKIAKKYNISKETVRKYIHKHDIEYNKLIRYNCNHDFFTNINEEVFYLAGFIAADGCVKDQRNALSIALSIKDKEFLIKIKNMLNSESQIHDFLVKNSKINIKWNDSWKSEITITSEKILKDLEKFNVVPRKSLIYTFPNWLINHPLVNHFMRGYFDGDGSFYCSKLSANKKIQQIYFNVRGTESFLTVFRTILEKECELKHRTSPIRLSSGHGSLEYGGNNILNKIAKFLYKDATIYLPRKFQIIKHYL